MHLPDSAHPADPDAQRAHDRRRLLRALNASLAAVLVLVAVFSAQGGFDSGAWSVTPWSLPGLWGLLTAPLLHGSLAHLVANASAVLLLGTLAGTVYPRATLPALPLLWLGSGLGAWLLGEPGSHHLGASGVTHGLGFLVFALGLLRRDRAAIAAGMIAFLFYGGMLLTVLPQEPGVSWQSHLGGAIGGIVAAWLFRKRDPQLPRRKYSWELEEELAAEQAARAAAEREQFELPSPRDVPVLWRRAPEERGTVLRFPGRRDP
jgi:membrane associated rhomboid family serine protease